MNTQEKNKINNKIKLQINKKQNFEIVEIK